MYIVLTHDVDSIKRPLRHVLSRWRRFTISDLIRHIFHIDNLYNNFDELISIEDSVGSRSTVFIPVQLFSIDEIKDKLKTMIREGWEIQLHYVYEPIQYEALFKMQKSYLESELDIKVQGVRVHNLIINDSILKMFEKEGIIYDTTYRAEALNTYSPLYIHKKIIELPIAVMDADLFGRLHMSEEKALRYIFKKLENAKEKNEKIFVILFHQEALRMKGGRIYSDLVKMLYERGYELVRCIDIVNRVLKGEIKV
ncbi:MAG: hypothetical protein GXO23_03000 [Crenarchaeota archaeon]|nr:hypothetical protein [Thermoproteota archaeon]